jgi:hypothetical protein
MNGACPLRYQIHWGRCVTNIVPVPLVTNAAPTDRLACGRDLATLGTGDDSGAASNNCVTRRRSLRGARVIGQTTAKWVVQFTHTYAAVGRP